MSIILEGIDLPEKNTRVICLFPNGAEELVVLDADSGATAGRPIQAIQIPKGHGRIGDLGKLAKLISDFGESLKESVRGNRLLMTERDLCHAIAVLTEHFQENEPLLEAEE